MTPAVQYVRASTGLQACSLDQQALANAAYAALRGFEILDTYSDGAASGLTLRQRPALQRLLAEALSPARRFKAILVYDVSRWGRFQDIDEGAHYEFLCRRAGVAVHYCAEPFENAGSPEANLIKQVKRAMAAEYSRALSERLTLARRHMVDQGFMVTPPPFGLLRQAIDGAGRPIGLLSRGQTKASKAHRIVFVPGPPQAVATVRRIFRLYALTGLSRGAIAKTLNAAGAPSPTGRGWTGDRVQRVLRCEAYVGTYVYGRVRYSLGRASKMAPQDWKRVENAFPPIIERAVFDLANRLLDARRRRTDAELLDDLRELLVQEGRLDADLIDRWPYMAHSGTYDRRFGGLSEAYRRIGYRPARARP
ncbi:recombinase family protein [Phenylobacterium sp.]|uniref:recombinase family protein n=1 Tax=Phenylobacterium sp. TaxID=1871053 RepID=UPI0035B373FC